MLNNKKISQSYIVLSVIFFIAVVFRWWYISDNHFQFHYEQARDALISREIIEKRDFKIQGPSAGNTGGTIYHGVLYYYIIGPTYTLFGGNPFAVVFLLAILNSSVVIPIYLISKEITGRNRVGYLASLLYAFSIDSTQMGIHLQNISLATISIPWLFFFIWKVFFQKQNKYLLFLALFLGVTHQFGIYLGYLIIPIIIAFLYRATIEKNYKYLSIKEIITAFFIYLLSISSIILTQLMLYRAGIFSFNDLSPAIKSHQSFIQNFLEAIDLYLDKISNSYLTHTEIITHSLVIFSVYFLIKKSKQKGPIVFILLWLISPFILITLIPRKVYYMLVGLNPAIFIIYSFFLFNFSKLKLQKLISLSLISIFIASNIYVANTQRKTASSPMYVSPQIRHEIDLIDTSYEISQGKDFSISSLTSPYKVNTLWAYLYDWYGKKKYGYKPLWFGPDQTGLPGGGLLTQTNDTLILHFTIIEPTTVDQKLVNEFLETQAIYSNAPDKTLDFGELKLDVREKYSNLRL